MTDRAVFVPTAEGPVGGVVSEPDGPPRGGVFLIPGYGRPGRSGTNSFWTRLARELAARGLVVLRVDWAGEGETLPLGEGRKGKERTELDARLLDQVLRWFHERLEGSDLFLAGSCSGARGVIELAGRDHPDAVARTYLIVPHVRVLHVGDAANRGGLGRADDPGAVDPLMVECLRVILDRGPSWVLVGEHDTPDLPRLVELLGPTAHELQIEVVPNTAIHFLDQPALQEEAGRRLLARIDRELAASAPRGSPAPPVRG